MLLTAFAIGISFAATFITLFYLTNAHEKIGFPETVRLRYIAMLSRFGYGFANMLNVVLGNTIFSSAISGGILGFIFSLFGRFQFDLPAQLFNMEKQNEWKVHVIAPIIYALIFVLLVRNLNLRVLGNS